jgi:hypothetical protein
MLPYPPWVLACGSGSAQLGWVDFIFTFSIEPTRIPACGDGLVVKQTGDAALNSHFQRKQFSQEYDAIHGVQNL